MTTPLHGCLRRAQDHGHSTLHQAAAKQASQTLVRLLLEARPEGAEEKDNVRGHPFL